MVANVRDGCYLLGRGGVQGVTHRPPASASHVVMTTRHRHQQQSPFYYNKKLSYRRETARCVVSVEILLIATQQCRKYACNTSSEQIEVMKLAGYSAGQCVINVCTQP